MPASGSDQGNTVAESAPLRLTLEDAIARGLEHNLAAVLAAEGEQAAEGARAVARSALLPSVAGDAVVSRQTISLDQYGFPVAPGESPLLGPYNVVLGQVTLSQPILDIAAIERSKAGGESLAAARFNRQDTRDLVVTACASLYLKAVADGSRVEAARAQVTTAEALERLALDMRQAGTVAGIEVLRAQVQLAAQRQRLIQAENTLDRDTLALAKAIGVPLARPLELADTVPYHELATARLDEALSTALAARADVKSAEALLRAAEDQRRAVQAGDLPSLHLDAGIGRVGPSWDTTDRTFSLMATLHVPLFEGGRVRGQVAQARAAVAQQRARVAELKARVELEVRTALLDLKAASEQVQVATGARDLAQQQLVQAEDRFSAGVASNIEVVQAQQALAEAMESYIASLAAHNLAKLELARALGVAEEQAGHYLGGGA